MRAIVYLLFLLSGACGLVYEVVWSRVMSEFLGSTVLAVGTVLAAFMSGLALGSYLIGRRADSASRPLRLYAYLEIGIGLTALAVQFLLDHAGWVYVGIHHAVGESDLVLGAVRFAFAFGLVLLPTVFMGATLPVLSRFVIQRLSAVGRSLSSLYSINTLGAVAGSLAAGFWLIGTLGIHRSVYVAVACNLTIGAIAWWVSARNTGVAAGAELESPVVEVASAPRVELDAAGYRLLLWAFGLSGFASFAYEIFWTRALVHLLGNSTYAFTMMLTAFLSGIALGGFLIRFFVDRLEHRLRWFAAIQILIGIASVAALPVLFRIVESATIKAFVHDMSNQVVGIMLSRFGVALLVMLVPATLIGTTFPLVGSLYVRNLRRTAADVGKVYAVNTVGNVVGALAPGFVLLPILGVQRGILLLAMLNVSLGLFIMLSSFRRWSPLRWAVPVGFAVLAILLPGVAIEFQFPAQSQTPQDRVLYYREGLSGTTKVFQEPNTGHKRMSIDGIVIGGTEFTDYKQQVLAHLPKLLLAEYDSELSVGLGSGILIGESLRHDGLNRIVCLEIESSVREGAAEFSVENHGVLDDPRAVIVIDDAAGYLRRTAERFDIISADEKTADKYASNGFSYSSDYYSLLRQHLSDRGMVIQWVPNHLPASQYAMVLKTFASAFPQVTVWYLPAVGKGGPMNTFMIGSLQEIEIDATRMDRRLSEEAQAFEGIRKYGLTTGESVLAQYVGDGRAVLDATGEARINTLENPYYEFFTPSDYSVGLMPRNLSNHDLLIRVRSERGLPDLEARLRGAPPRRLRAAFAAQDRFFDGMRLQLEGGPFKQIAPLYDAALAIASWNGNLRQQILPYYWNEAGILYLDGRYPEALQLMGRAVETYPEYGEVRYYHGLILLYNGDRAGGLSEMRRAIALDSRLLAPRRTLATEALRSGSSAEAVEYLEAILDIDPDDVFSLVTLGSYLAESGTDPIAAAAHVERAFDLAPADPSVTDARAWVAFRAGDQVAARGIVLRGGRYYEADPQFGRRRWVILQSAP